MGDAIQGCYRNACAGRLEGVLRERGTAVGGGRSGEYVL